MKIEARICVEVKETGYAGQEFAKVDRLEFVVGVEDLADEDAPERIAEALTALDNDVTLAVTRQLHAAHLTAAAKREEAEAAQRAAEAAA